MNLTINTEKVYLVSDLHINHHKLCSGYDDHFDTYRKYVTTDEMNADIIKQWNDTVTDDDIVINLGDQMMNVPGSKLVETFTKYYNELHFKHMYMIRGNHDFELFKKLNKVISQYPKITLVNDYIELDKDNKKYLFQHYTYDDNEFGNPNVLNILTENGKTFDYLVHGHTHSEFKASAIVKNDKYKLQNCVCWDAWYRPVSLNEVIASN